VGAQNDQVVAGDLAKGFQEWAAVPSDTPLGLAPAPGAQRVFRLPELRRLAERFDITSAPDHEVCVTRPVSALSADRMLAAMQRELPAAHINLLDFSRQPAPEGELVFPISGLRQTSGGGYWTGYVTYGGKHHFMLWARVEVRMAATRVIAVRDIKPGEALDAPQFRIETRDEIPATAYAGAVEEVTGMVSRRAIAAGTALRKDWLEAAKVVMRGETVEVEAVQGGAHLKLEGIAEGSGSPGDIIPIQNPISKQRFMARVECKGKVVATKGSL
jgi:flagella basal body P-ring formation protein FlgA